MAIQEKRKSWKRAFAEKWLNRKNLEQMWSRCRQKWARLQVLMVRLNDRQRALLGMVLLATWVAALILFRSAGIPSYKPGNIATRDVKAPRNLLVPDRHMTEKKRLEAQREVLPLYDFDPNTSRAVFLRVREALKWLQGPEGKNSSADESAAHLGKVLGTNVSVEEVEHLRAQLPEQFDPDSFPPEAVNRLRAPVVGNLQLFLADADQGIVVRDLNAHTEALKTDFKGVIDLDAYNQRFVQILRGDPKMPSELVDALLPVLLRMTMPNLTFNKNETEGRRMQAAEAVGTVLYRVKKGEMIVREGDRVSEEQIEKIEAYRARNPYRRWTRVSAGIFVCVFLMLWCIHRFGEGNIRKYQFRGRDLLFMGTLLFCFLPFIKLFIFIFGALENAFPWIDSSIYYYLLPFASATMLVRIVLNAETATLFAMVSTFLYGSMCGDNLSIIFYAVIGSLVGAHYVRHCEQRSYIYLAGVRLMLVNSLLAAGMYLGRAPSFDMAQLVYHVVFASIGGLLCAVVVIATIPLAESIFGYTTNIKLLELANMNNPLLRELMVQAPGTYHHSVIVGNLAEAAAESIHANPLIARVGAYYHDIGKIRKPLYFIENSSIQENRHDKLAPSMSALILMAHVKDGVEMAKAAKLGEPIEEIIRQHHGTSLIRFFYDKARKKEEEEGGDYQVDEREYRYPGPRPQSREAALIMLADSVEAASRTLTDPTPARINGMVQKLINNIFIDGQLDNCELTLKDLHHIARSFNLILTGIFHQRIEYPEPVGKEREKEKNGDKEREGKTYNGDNSHREPAKKSRDRSDENGEDSQQDLRRLGMP